MRNVKRLLLAGVATTLLLGSAACKSTHDSGVTSNIRSQWTTVRADVKATTAAAEAVLGEADLKEVKSNATNVDGTASGKKADGTKVNVAIRKEQTSTSEVSVTIGTVGDPSLGAEMVRKIKERAEGSAAK